MQLYRSLDYFYPAVGPFQSLNLVCSELLSLCVPRPISAKADKSDHTATQASQPRPVSHGFLFTSDFRGIETLSTFEYVADTKASGLESSSLRRERNGSIEEQHPRFPPQEKRAVVPRRRGREARLLRRERQRTRSQGSPLSILL